MDSDREKKVAEIKKKIRQDSYRVDPKAVADAIVRRMNQIPQLGATARARSRTVVRSSR
jgi:hypothetical protein